MAMGLPGAQGNTLLASASRSTSSNTGNIRDTAQFVQFGDGMALYTVVSALANSGGAGPTLDIYFETSPDFGTTWFLSQHFAQISSSTASRRIDFRITGPGLKESAVEDSIISTTTTVVKQNTVHALEQRVRWVFSSGASATFGVWSIVQGYKSAAGSDGT